MHKHGEPAIQGAFDALSYAVVLGKKAGHLRKCRTISSRETRQKKALNRPYYPMARSFKCQTIARWSELPLQEEMSYQSSSSCSSSTLRATSMLTPIG